MYGFWMQGKTWQQNKTSILQLLAAAILEADNLSMRKCANAGDV